VESGAGHARATGEIPLSFPGHLRYVMVQQRSPGSCQQGVVLARVRVELSDAIAVCHAMERTLWLLQAAALAWVEKQ
jgi:hypothetical protein